MVSTEPFHYRPRFGAILACVVVALCLAALIGLAIAGNGPDLLRTVWPLSFFGFLAVALFWRPRIRIEEHSVTVVNVFRTIEVPWPAIERIDTRFSVTLFTATMRIPVWAAPSPGIHGAVGIDRADVRNLNESAYGPGHTVRPGDSVGTPSGQVAFVLRQRWEALRLAGHLESGLVEAGSLRVSTHWATILVLSALFTASALSFVP